jgi:hypothetical protein
MKNTIKLFCLMLTALILFVSCNQTVQPPADTDDDTSVLEDTATESVDSTTPDETKDTEKTPETEPIVDDFDPSADPRYGTAVNVDCDELLRMSRRMGTDFSNLEQMCVNWFNSLYKDKHINPANYFDLTITPEEYSTMVQNTAEVSDKITLHPSHQKKIKGRS